MRPAVLPRSFFARPAPTVASELVGMVLQRPELGLAARIVEVEAYVQDDPACHAFNGQTARNATLFGLAGHAYVYFTYGMHWCLNTVTGDSGSGQGVLLRAAEPLEGEEVMRRHRGDVRHRDLLRGPARLAQAFGIDAALNGADFCGDGPLVLVDDGAGPTRAQIVATPRTGVSRGADTPWRFALKDSPWVSPYKRHPKAPHPPHTRCGGTCCR